LNFTIPRSVEQFCLDVQAVAARSGRSEALQMVVELARVTSTSEMAIATVLSSRPIDAACQELGRTTAAVDVFDPEQSVFLVTALSRSGGHTRVLREVIDVDPGKRSTVLVTNVLHQVELDDIRQAFGDASVDIQIAPAGMALGDTVDWVQERLLKLRAERTYILQHHFDAVVSASVQPSLVKQLYYLHNCDHSFALGVHLPHAVHVDLHGPGFHVCREREGIRGNVCWPLTAGPREQIGQGFGEMVQRTCTAGGREKFDTSHLIERVPYLLTYPETVRTILATTGGVHHHIGALPAALSAAIASELDAHGIGRERFVHTEFVPNLSHYMVENGIELYVTSMPWGGGRTLVEMMATGLPILIHSNYRSMLLTDQCSAYPEALTWRSYEELAARLRQFSRAVLQRQSEAALAFYQRHHQTEALRSAVERTLRGESLPEPAAPTYTPDAMQTFLDLHAARLDHVWVTASDLARREAQIRELEQAFRMAETLALERLAEMARLDKQLILTDQALNAVTGLVHQRDAEIIRLQEQLREKVAARPTA